MSRFRVVQVLAATIALTAACASSATPTSAPAAGGASGAVDISGFAFVPATLDVAKGSKVTLTNKDGTTHHVASGVPGSPDGKFDGGVAGGATFSFTFNDGGTFKYFCSIHTTMIGTITVK